MPLDTPTRSELTSRTRADIKAALPSSDPYQVTSILNSIAVANANRSREIYDSHDIIVRDTYTTTAEREALEREGLDYGLSPNTSTQATGNVIATGLAGTNVPITTEIQGLNGETYTTDITKTIAESFLNVTTLASSGLLATATFTSAHGLATGLTVTIAGAVETEYNGGFVITVISETVFQFTLLSSTTTPATGTITATFTIAIIPVTSESTGSNTNVIGGSTLVLGQTISNVDSTIYTQFLGIDGGSDTESTDSFRSRLLLKKQNPETPFNKINIELESRKISGVTRVWVFGVDDINTSSALTSITATSGSNIALFPTDHDLLSGMVVEISGANETEFNGTFEVLKIDGDEILYYNAGNTGSATGSLIASFANVQYGQVLVMFVRDGDLTIIPSSQEIQDVKDQILTILPADNSVVDLKVEAPILKEIDFDFTALTPDTVGLRLSIEQNLTDLFFSTSPGETITSDAYRTAIQSSFDLETSLAVASFTLSTPLSDIASEYNEIVAIGDVTYSV